MVRRNFLNRKLTWLDIDTENRWSMPERERLPLTYD